MKKILLALIVLSVGCKKSNSSTGGNNSNAKFQTVSYDVQYYGKGGAIRTFTRSDTQYLDAKDSFYFYTCWLLVSQKDTTQQHSYPYFIGSYDNFIFGGTYNGTMKFLSFSVPTDGFPSIYMVPLNYNLNVSGGINGYYGGTGAPSLGLTNDSLKFLPEGDTGPNAQGIIDSAEINLTITRFSNNGIQPSSTYQQESMDGIFSLSIYCDDGSSFVISNGKFTNLLYKISDH